MTNAIELNNFTYCYPDGTQALEGITFSVGYGSKTVLIGPNGAGKSTVLLAMAGFIKGQGRIVVDGIEVDGKNSKKLRQVLGCCLQDPDDQLFMPRLFDDVAFGPLNMGLDEQSVKKRVDDAIDLVGLTGMEGKAPHHLSAGQKRAAAIATVLSMSPKIITFDEPDSSLDPAGRNKIIELLRSLEQTIVVATCSMNFAAAIADNVVLINGGRVVEMGAANEIMSDEKLMSEHRLEVPYMFRHRA